MQKRPFLRNTLTLLLTLQLLTIAAVYLHYRHTGLTPHRYIGLGIDRIDAENSPIRRQAAMLARTHLLSSRLVKDHIKTYPPGLQMPLPTWRGNGANALRDPVRPRYRNNGEPIALAETGHWSLHEPQTPGLDISVDSTEGLVNAMATVGQGARIALEPGIYTISTPLTLDAVGTAEQPLQLSASRLGEAVLVFKDGGSLRVSEPHWAVTDLIIPGECRKAGCTPPLVLGERAAHFTARNLFVTGVDLLLSSLQEARPHEVALLEGITLLNGQVSAPHLRAREIAVRQISQANQENALITLCPSARAAADCNTTSLAAAAKKVATGGLILIRRGEYRQAAHFRAPGIHLLAEPGARLLGTATEGKGAIVVSASITIEGLECSGIVVADGNGACLRQNRGDVTLLGVHFHHAQMALLSGHEGGRTRIYDSYFHDSGADGNGNLGHNIYINSGQLDFVRSWSLMARNAGHELKSRAVQTRLKDCLIASVNARDSRLVDIPDGGELIMTGCVLGKGPRSENQDMIGFGLEIGGGPPPPPR